MAQTESTNITSRRRFLVRAVAVAAAPVAVLTAPSASAATSLRKVDEEPTAIGKMWIEREAVRREYEAKRKLRKKLEAELARRMPKPDASITFSPENDEDGLRYWGKGEPHTLHHHIWPEVIERALSEVKPAEAELTRIDAYEAIVFRHVPLTAEQSALRDRLAARLDLSRRYKSEVERVSRKIGLAGLERKGDRLCSRQGDIEYRILRSPSGARSDLAVKLAIHKYHGDDWAAEYIVRDVRRLVDQPSAFAKAWGPIL